MDINGLIKVGLIEPSAEGNYGLSIDFTDDFQPADLLAVFETPGGEHEPVKHDRGELARLLH